MAIVIQNSPIAENIYRLRVDCSDNIKAGQFYMLRAWGTNPTFSRPISICDKKDGETVFVYEAKGKGTKVFSSLKTGDKIELLGPRGNGFDIKAKQSVIIGGGVGIAPLLLLAKQLKHNGAHITAFLGYSREEYLVEEISRHCDRVISNTGGLITDDIDEFDVDRVYICGPAIMMQKAYELYKDMKCDIFVSVERRMACGIGACLGCNIVTKNGNKKVCSDGPVFNAKDIFYE
jgi:dihydroorotate dehydrogenase electron transfer subunit